MESATAKERLTDAAFALFDERGFEHTTVDEIAERAGVGRTTYFRNFRSKEDVIFPDHDAILAAVQERLAASTPQTAVVAVSEAARLVLQHYLAEGNRARSRFAITRSVPALRDRERARLQQYQRLFHRFIHEWMGGGAAADLRAELMANAVVTAHNHVLRRWLRGVTERPESEFDEAMAEVVDLFTQGSDGTDAVVILRTDRDLTALVPRIQRMLG
jgi:AcrR family transcriptional regulator